jgi:hypothetical protein
MGAMLLEQGDEWAAPLAFQFYSAEHRVHLSLSGLWSYTTRWDTVHP